MLGCLWYSKEQENVRFCHKHSSTGYFTADYFNIDPNFGTNEDFKQVVEHLHAEGIKVVLDGVFNHVGRGFFGFEDVLKNRETSEYKDWFHINFWGNSHYNDGFYYEGWEGNYVQAKTQPFSAEKMKTTLLASKAK